MTTPRTYDTFRELMLMAIATRMDYGAFFDHIEQLPEAERVYAKALIQARLHRLFYHAGVEAGRSPAGNWLN